MNKNFKLKHIFLVLLIPLFTLQCNNEDIIIEEAQQNNVETIAPSIALNEINTNPSFKNNSNRASRTSLFDKIDLTKDAKKYTAEDREIHYTFALKNVNNSTNARSNNYQYTTDNLNIKLNPDGSQIISIFRYIPDMSWFNNPSNDITSYTGQIQVLNESLDIISSFNLVDAQVIEAGAASRGIGSRSTDSCSLELREICTELIHSGGFTTGLYCEVIITTNCVGGGREEGTVNDGNTGGTNENPTGTSGSGEGGTTSGTAILDTCLETNTCYPECPNGQIADKDGNCIDKPCSNDPIPSPKIAPQKGRSGSKGALQGCTRYGGSCSGEEGRSKSHAGIDLKNDFGQPIFAMHDGFIYSTKFQKNGAGYYTRIQGTLNGQNVLTEYFHLQKENRILQNSPGDPLIRVKAGDIIGYQGDSGNLKKAIADGGVDSHVHIEVRLHDGSNRWGYDNFILADPRNYISTTIDDNGTSGTNDCN